jgi:hypothetical protein
VDDIRIEGDALVLSGWAPWEDVNETQGLLVRTGRFAVGASIEPVTRPDVARVLGDERYLRSGFTARIPLTSLPADSRELPVCVVAMDRQQGWSIQLPTPPGFQPCG